MSEVIVDGLFRRIFDGCTCIDEILFVPAQAIPGQFEGLGSEPVVRDILCEFNEIAGNVGYGLIPRQTLLSAFRILVCHVHRFA